MCTKPMMMKRVEVEEEDLGYSTDLWYLCDGQQDLGGWPSPGAEDDITTPRVHLYDDEELKLEWPLPGTDANRAQECENAFPEMPSEGSFDELSSMNLKWLDTVVSGLDLPFDQLCESFDNPPAVNYDEPVMDEIILPSDDFVDAVPLAEEGENQLVFDSLDLEEILKNLANPDASNYCLSPVDETIDNEPSHGEDLEVVSLLETALRSFPAASSLEPENNSDFYETDGSCSDEDDYMPSRKRLKKERPGNVEKFSKMSRKNRQMRKKEQNKSAATRYREKRRLEEMERHTMCEQLEKRNEFLRKDVADKEQEVKILRQLLIDIFKKP